MRDSLDMVTLYFKGIKSLGTFSELEIKEYWRRAKRGDKKAQKKLAECNLRLVIPVARKYYRIGLDFLDLVEEGNLGLIHAVEKFDPKRGFRFSTYAAYWIEQAIRRAVYEQSKTIRIPPHAWEALRKWMKESDRLHGVLGRTPTISEVSQRLHLSPRQVKGVMDAIDAARDVDSIETPLDSEEDLYVKDILSDSEHKTPDNIISMLRQRDELDKALSKIGKRERLILELRFGLNGGERETLEAIGKKLKLSRERVRQLEERGKRRLRQLTQKMGMA